MRRCLASIAAVALLLSSVGAAIAGEPTGSATPAPVIEPQPPTDPSPAASSAPATDPSVPAASPSEAVPSVPAVDPEPSADASASAAPSTERPSAGPSASPVAPPAHVKPVKPTPDGVADPTNRWIVVLKSGTDAVATADRQGRKQGFKSDRLFRNAFRGYAAHMSKAQVQALRKDPSVAAIVADEVIHVEAQTMPTGVARINDRASKIAVLDGIDQRVDADVAIVDTGISRVADLNVAGGYN
jgi:hypothetical protein